MQLSNSKLTAAPHLKLFPPTVQCGGHETDIGALCTVTPSTGVKNGRKCGYSWPGIYWDPACCFGGWCDAGYTNNGCTCGRGGATRAKGTYGRGVGVPMVCASQYESNAGLCYDRCPPATTSFVTMCIKQCPADLPYDCGVMCAKDLAGCGSMIAKMASYAGSNAAVIAGCLAAGVGTAGLATLGCAGALVGLAVSAGGVALGFEVC